jgi:flavin-dependent dehydrogenase
MNLTTLSLNQNIDYDVIIIGGGPAGYSAGLTLLKRGGVSVAVVDMSSHVDANLSQSLSANVRPLLEYLNLWPQVEKEYTQCLHLSQAAWGRNEMRQLKYMNKVQGSAWNIDRSRFDQMMADEFCQRGGVLLKNHQVMACSVLPNALWKLQLEDEKHQVKMLRCRYVIDASGRKHFMSKELDIPLQVHDRLIGFGCIGVYPENAVKEFHTQVETCEYGWWYTACLPGNRMACVLMSDPDIIPKMRIHQFDEWKTLMSFMPFTSLRTADVVFYEKPKSYPCFTSILKEVGGKNWIAVGDALISQDPLLSSGIPNALTSGMHGGLVAADSLCGNNRLLDIYRDSILEDFSLHLKTKWEFYQSESRWADSLFWKRRRSVLKYDLHSLISKINLEKVANLTLAHHINFDLMHDLLDQCAPMLALHQIVRQFIRLHPELPERLVNLAMQEWIEVGVIELDLKTITTHISNEISIVKSAQL